MGQKCFKKGQAKNTYGTGCFLLYNTGQDIVFSKNGLLTTLAFQLGPKAAPFYALEGSIAVAGAAISWLKEKAGLISDVDEFNEILEKTSGTEGVYFVPAFSGLFAPYWRSDARGTIVGMTLKTGREQIIRSVMESICFQTYEVGNALIQAPFMMQNTGSCLSQSVMIAGKRRVLMRNNL